MGYGINYSKRTPDVICMKMENSKGKKRGGLKKKKEKKKKRKEWKNDGG